MLCRPTLVDAAVILAQENAAEICVNKKKATALEADLVKSAAAHKNSSAANARLASEAEQANEQHGIEIQLLQSSEARLRQLLAAASERQAKVDEQRSTAEQRATTLQSELEAVQSDHSATSTDMHALQLELEGVQKLLPVHAEAEVQLNLKLSMRDETVAALQEQAEIAKAENAQQSAALAAACETSHAAAAQEVGLRSDLGEAIDHAEFQLHRIQDLEGEAAVAKVIPHPQPVHISV